MTIYHIIDIINSKYVEKLVCYVIIFFGGAEIAIILFILVAIIAGSVETIVGMTNFFIILFIIKNTIQTIILGLFKNKNPLSYSIAFFITDIARMTVFFSNLKSIGTNFVTSVGLSYFSSLFGMVLYILICGTIFLAGEGISLVQALGNTDIDQRGNNKLALFGGISTLVLLVIITWIGYL